MRVPLLKHPLHYSEAPLHLSQTPLHRTQAPLPSPPPHTHTLAGDSGRPTITTLVPGGTILYENRNLGGKAATFAASINTKNFWSPADDLSFRLMYSQVRSMCVCVCVCVCWGIDHGDR